MGRVHADAGRAAMRLHRGRRRAWRCSGACSAIVTAPVHKEALAAAGSPFPGHTEMLQARGGRRRAAAEVRMMLANDELRVVLVTIHVSLRRAIEQLSVERIATTIRLAHEAGRRIRPVARRASRWPGLNPHAGEGGLFGDEEIEPHRAGDRARARRRHRRAADRSRPTRCSCAHATRRGTLASSTSWSR